MGRTIAIAGLAAVFLCVLAAGCGGSSAPTGPQLSAKAYKAKLVFIGKESSRAEVQANYALQAKTVTLMRDYLTLFATAEQKIGDQIERLNPPANANSANSKLASGAHDISGAASDAVAKMSSLNDSDLGGALALLKQNSRGEKGSQEVTDALMELRKLGYEGTVKTGSAGKPATTTAATTTSGGGTGG